MKKHICIQAWKACFLTFGFLLVASGGQGMAVHAADLVSYTGELKVHFFATSTLHDFEGDIPAVPLTAKRTVDTAPSQSDHWEVVSKVGVDTLTTHHEKRDKKMFEMFKVDRFPSFVLKVSDAIQTASKGEQAHVPVQVTILDKTLKLDGVVTDWSDKDGKVAFRLETVIFLEAFGLERPGTAFGLIKVGDEVRVEADVQVSRKEAKND